jgi:hypothetical protein
MTQVLPEERQKNSRLAAPEWENESGKGAKTQSCLSLAFLAALRLCVKPIFT